MELQYQKDKLKRNLEHLRERSRENDLLSSVIVDYERYEERLRMKDRTLTEQKTAHEQHLQMLDAYIRDIMETNDLTESGLNKITYENNRILSEIDRLRTSSLEAGTDEAKKPEKDESEPEKAEAVKPEKDETEQTDKPGKEEAEPEKDEAVKPEKDETEQTDKPEKDEAEKDESEQTAKPEKDETEQTDKPEKDEAEKDEAEKDETEQTVKPEAKSVGQV